jgi:hypothetical protein
LRSKAVAGQGGASRGVGVQWIEFALAAARSPIRVAELGHLDLPGLQDLGQDRSTERQPNKRQ